MQIYETTIESPSGIQSAFKISVDKVSNFFKGEMIWEADLYLLRKVRASGNDGFHCELFWLGNYARTWIVATNQQGTYSLSIRIMGQSFDYALTEQGYLEFISFVSVLTLSTPPLMKRADPEEFDRLMDESELKQTTISLYQGSNIYKNLPVHFSSCSVNGLPVNVSFPNPLPNDLGTYLLLGYFATGEILQIQWTFEVWDVPTLAKLAIGAFRDGKLSKRTVLQVYELQPYQSFKGSASLTV